MAFGGAPGTITATEEYDGSSWTAGGNLNTGRRELAGCGTQTAGLAFGGDTGSNSAATELYNGTSWTASAAMNTGRQLLAGAGIQTAGLAFGGSLSPKAQTEEFSFGNQTKTISSS